MNIFARLAQLETLAAHNADGKMKLVFSDGHTEFCSGGEAVDRCFWQGGRGIVHVEGGPSNGLLPGLLEGLLKI